MIHALILLFGYQLLGTVIEQHFGLPVPGPVMGMVFLLLTLFIYPALVPRLQPVTTVLIKYLPLLFVPAATGIITFKQLLSFDGIALFFVLVLSTMIGILSTAWIFCKLARRWAPPTDEERAA